jgi:Icc-related predicted phosphoesterase
VKAVRIAFLVDVHGRFEAVADAMRSIGETDLLVIGGDITTAGTAADARQAIDSWRPLAPRIVALAGNMDSPEIDSALGDLGVGLDGRGLAFGEVGLFGVSAAPKSPLHTPYELTEEELAGRIAAGFEAVRDCRVKIFCPHAPPRGTACDRLRTGEHVGSVAVREFVDREHPDVVLCGHIHEARAIDEVGRSQVVNPGPAAGGHYALAEIGETVSVRLDSST